MKPISLALLLGTAAMIVLTCRRGTAAPPAPAVETFVGRYVLSQRRSGIQPPDAFELKPDGSCVVDQGGRSGVAGTWRAAPNGVFTMTLASRPGPMLTGKYRRGEPAPTGTRLAAREEVASEQQFTLLEGLAEYALRAFPVFAMEEPDPARAQDAIVDLARRTLGTLPPDVEARFTASFAERRDLDAALARLDEASAEVRELERRRTWLERTSLELEDARAQRDEQLASLGRRFFALEAEAAAAAELRREVAQSEDLRREALHGALLDRVVERRLKEHRLWANEALDEDAAGHLGFYSSEKDFEAARVKCVKNHWGCG